MRTFLESDIEGWRYSYFGAEVETLNNQTYNNRLDEQQTIWIRQAKLLPCIVNRCEGTGIIYKVDNESTTNKNIVFNDTNANSERVSILNNIKVIIFDVIEYECDLQNVI